MQLIGIIILIVTGVGILGGLLYVGLKENAGSDPLQARLAEYADREVPATLEELEMSLSFRDRVVVPIFKAIANLATHFTPEQQIESTRKQLELAGKATKTDPRTFFGTRILLTGLFGVGAFFLFFIMTKQSFVNAVGLTVGAALLGYYLPALQLKGQISKPQNNILKALPDALDLLTISVEAGFL